MTEDEARRWINACFDVSRETLLVELTALIVAEAANQNLVSASSLESLWTRHIVDSAQLIPLAARHPGSWIDIGSGAGFPGLVVAILTDRPVTLIEPRRKRAQFLERAVAVLQLGARVTVVAARAEQYQAKAAVISARAVSAVPELLTSAAHLSTTKSLWLLPKGPRALEEVEAARRTWHGSFHVEQSITEASSLIITAKGVARR
ncbi:16S rRNA (guanine(527)-N(7))-methyltransferase RsmG [Sphingomonas sp. 28-63-12]|uniref:16S rRNA (guanine(527)-N(7))-methyltransferase RsmG n=1 Tax=Sphingomonas sp. 28-63-12 TaxID=1970434 RepID=UPI000BC9FFC4|nr:MAG: 16S rRNA (guanine(527)-N(7))-methyltransferase RsmG [Sphingomonas sp. 28-63-12]